VHFGYEVYAGGAVSVHFGYEVHAGGAVSVHFGYEVRGRWTGQMPIARRVAAVTKPLTR
jgi:hypothetical protein